MPNLPNDKPTLAVIITAHREGVLLWPSLRSAAATVAMARAAGYVIEVCLVLNDADSETTRLGEQALAYNLVDKITTSSVGDPGQSRLIGLGETDSQLVAIMDGDDLFSTDWLLKALEVWIASDGRAIVHPEWRLFFDEHQGWQRFTNQTDPTWQLHQQALVFDYSSAALAARTAWTNHPFLPAAIGSGLGYEDWHWGLETIAAGYLHVVAPGTIRFYRQRAVGVCQQHNQLKSLLRPSAYYDLPAYRDITTVTVPPRPISRTPGRWRQYSRRVAHQWRAALAVTMEPWLRRLRRRPSGHPSTNPRLMAACRVAARLEPLLAHPNKPAATAPVTPIDYFSRAAVTALPRLLNDWDRAVGDQTATHAIFVPWIMRSGADRIVAHYAAAIKQAGGYPVIILTERSLVESGVLPADLPVVDASHLQSLPPAIRRQHLARLIIQRQPAHTLLINGVAMIETASRYARALTTYTKLWAVDFTQDQSLDGLPSSWLSVHLENLAPYLSGILTDSHTHKLTLLQTFGLPADLLTTAYTPLPPPEGKYDPPTGRPRVLWAGRLDRQKRPDRLIKLARRLPHVDFEVWGRGYLEDTRRLSRELSREPNIRLRGGYDRFADITAIHHFNAFIYTAEWDGLPIVILEAIAAGLPVVTTDSGGVGELIDNSCGWLVSQADGPAAFISALRDCLDHPDRAGERVKVAQARLVQRHSAASFINTLRQIGLLSTTKQTPNSLN